MRYGTQRYDIEINTFPGKVIECDSMRCGKILPPQLVANINPKKMKPIEI